MRMSFGLICRRSCYSPPFQGSVSQSPSFRSSKNKRTASFRFLTAFSFVSPHDETSSSNAWATKVLPSLKTRFVNWISIASEFNELRYTWRGYQDALKDHSIEGMTWKSNQDMLTPRRIVRNGVHSVTEGVAIFFRSRLSPLHGPRERIGSRSPASQGWISDCTPWRGLA